MMAARLLTEIILRALVLSDRKLACPISGEATISRIRVVLA
jgi:hypothetical protein